MENSFDYKEYYEKTLMGKVAYCGDKADGNFFKLGCWGYYIETLDVDTDEYISQYIWYDVFEMFLDGIWSIDDFVICDEFKQRMIEETRSKLTSLERDIQYTKIKLEKYLK